MNKPIYRCVFCGTNKPIRKRGSALCEKCFKNGRSVVMEKIGEYVNVPERRSLILCHNCNCAKRCPHEGNKK